MLSAMIIALAANGGQMQVQASEVSIRNAFGSRPVAKYEAGSHVTAASAGPAQGYAYLILNYCRASLTGWYPERGPHTRRADIAQLDNSGAPT